MAKPRDRLLVVDVAAMGWDLARRYGTPGLEFHPLETVFPAVTCTVQASFRTASRPAEHGMVANGLYFRDLRKPMFWEQAASLVAGERIWRSFRSAGKRVGMMFWQQSLGEELDLVLSPRPIHKHGGGMIQDCYSHPEFLYTEICRRVGRRFNLMHYWGPLASRKSSDWIVDAVETVMTLHEDAPDLLLCYLPHLDYDLQRHGPESNQAAAALRVLCTYLTRLRAVAEENGYEFLFFGDYAMAPVTGAAVFPNRALRDAGLLRTRTVKGMAYPDLFGSPAFAVVDHEVAHVVATDTAATRAAAEVLGHYPGVAACLGPDAQREMGIAHDRSGDLVLIAQDGAWFAYPWWSADREAPDYATHVDIHNKPGYDPCELFFGWPPMSVGMNPERVGGTHGRRSSIAWASTLTPTTSIQDVTGLAEQIRHWCGHAR